MPQWDENNKNKKLALKTTLYVVTKFVFCSIGTEKEDLIIRYKR